MKWLLLALMILSILIVVPPIAYHYVYPSWGGDSADHLIYFNNMKGEFPLIDYWAIQGGQPLYYGEYFTGKLLNTLPIELNTSFLWFNYAVFVLVVWVVGVATYYAVNPLAGILASILVSFGCLKTIGLFVGGTIFDLMGIGLLLPLALLCLHNREKGVYWKVLGVIALITFAFWHSNGKYVIALLPIVVAYELARGWVSKGLDGVVKQIWDNRYLAYLIMLVLAIVAGYSVNVVGKHSVRLLTDAMILAMVAIATIVALLPFPKKNWVQLVLIALAVGVSIPNVLLWFQNNNVVKEADKQAFAYLNELEIDNYPISVSAVVSQDIYQLFVKQRFISGYGDYVVVRSIPMAFRKGYNKENLDRLKGLDIYGYKLVETFDCGEREYLTREPVKVEIYRAGYIVDD